MSDVVGPGKQKSCVKIVIIFISLSLNMFWALKTSKEQGQAWLSLWCLIRSFCLNIKVNGGKMALFASSLFSLNRLGRQLYTIFRFSPVLISISLYSIAGTCIQKGF